MQERYGSKFFFVSLLCSLALLLSLFWTYVSALVLALMISSVLYPLYSLVKKGLGGHSNTSSLLMCFFILIVLFMPLWWFVDSLSNEAHDFYKRTSNAVSVSRIQKIFEIDSVWTQRIKKIGKMAGVEFTPETVEKISASVGKNIGLFLYNQIRSMASNLFSILLHFFLMMLTSYYLFRDGTRLKNYITQLLPVPKEQFEKVVVKFQEVGRAIIIGNGLSGIVQGFLGGLGFYFFGLSSPIMWGTVLAFMAFLPIIGASIVFVPAAAILIIQGKVGLGIGYLIYNVVYSAVIEYLIKPRLIGKGMEMNSLLVFIGIIGGIKLFGILGIIYGPLIITIFLTLAEIYRLEYKQLPV